MRVGWLIFVLVSGFAQLGWELWQRRETSGGLRVVCEPPGAQIFAHTLTAKGRQRLLAGRSGQPLNLPADGLQWLEVARPGYHPQTIQKKDLVGSRVPVQGAITLVPVAAWTPWLAFPGFWVAGVGAGVLAVQYQRSQRRRRWLHRNFQEGKAQPGQNIGPYTVVSTLGSGGMARVYEVFLRDDPRERRALKLLHAPGAGERFVREARISVGLRHPHLVAFYDYGEYEGRAYLVMEKVQGKTLDQCRGVGLSQQLLYLAQVAEALQVLHEQGIVHRDLKPSNIMVSGSKAILMDFGIARSIHEQQQVTMEGHAVGTPGYMAPEQILGQAPEVSLDLYAFGVVLYEICGGRLPYEAETSFELINKQLSDEPLPLGQLKPQLPDGLVELTMNLLARQPELRPGPCSKVAESLRIWAERLDCGEHGLG